MVAVEGDEVLVALVRVVDRLRVVRPHLVRVRVRVRVRVWVRGRGRVRVNWLGLASASAQLAARCHRRGVAACVFSHSTAPGWRWSATASSSSPEVHAWLGLG